MFPRYSSASSPTVSSANRSHLRGAVRVVRHRVGLEHLHDDRGDVVEPTAAVRLGDQRLHLALGLRGRAEKLRQASVVDHAGEAIARDEEDVAGPYLAP